MWAGTYCASAPLFSTVPYLRVPIVLCPSHSLLSVDVSKYLYVVYKNNMRYEIKSNLVMLCSIPTGTLCYKIYVMYSYGRCENSDI